MKVVEEGGGAKKGSLEPGHVGHEGEGVDAEWPQGFWDGTSGFDRTKVGGFEGMEAGVKREGGTSPYPPPCDGLPPLDSS